MGLFSRKQEQSSSPQPAAAPSPPPEPDIREQIRVLAPVLEQLLSGDLDSRAYSTLTDTLGAGMAPNFFPEDSIWARSSPFADRAGAVGEWPVVVQLYELMQFFMKTVLPEMAKSNPQTAQFWGRPRHGDIEALTKRAVHAAQQVDARQVVTPLYGQNAGSFLLNVPQLKGTVVDVLARPLDTVNRTRVELDAVLERARNGDPAAIAYENSLKTEDSAEMRRHLLESARLGSVEGLEAMAELAVADGDVEAEARWATSAANAGSSKAMMLLAGTLYRQGKIAESRDWFEKAAQAGAPDAYYLLGRIAAESDGDQAARRWFSLGADADHPACMVEEGRTIAKLATTEDALGNAYGWYVEAARRGSADGMYEAGLLAETFRNDAQATYWYQNASRAGNADAKAKLDVVPRRFT
jgi:hypothetical protein